MAAVGQQPGSSMGAAGETLAAVWPVRGARCAFLRCVQRDCMQWPFQPSGSCISQVTFRWHNTYLGVVMVYDAQSEQQQAGSASLP